MAKVVTLRAVMTSSNEQEKLPSFSKEAELFVDYGHVNPTAMTQLNSPIHTPSNDEQPKGSEASPDTAVLTDSSTSSFHAIFETDDVVPPQDFTAQETPLSPGGDVFFNGDGDLLAKEARNQASDPPFSLYAANKLYPVESSESYGNKPENFDLDSGRNTPTSPSGSQTMPGSVSSTHSSISRSGGSIPRPIMYSAIGSLEHPNAVSLGSLNKRLLTTGKGFARLGGAPLALIPPVNASAGRSIVDDSKSTNSGPSGLLNYKVTPKVTKRDRASRDSSLKTSSTSTGAKVQKPSNLRSKKGSAPGTKNKNGKTKRVSYKTEAKKPIEMFRPSCDAYTPRIEKKIIKYKAAEKRTPVQKMSTPMGTLQRPNFRDALRRVAMIIRQHIVKIEQRFEASGTGHGEKGLFKASMREIFSEESYSTPKFTCTMVRIPMARPGMVYGLRKINTEPKIPSEEEIYEFAHQLFKTVQLSSECSIVCLIYVERLMEIAKVPLLACTWRPIFMCGLLLASKVWQDLSSWNIEFASVYPQYSLDAINRLELNFLRNVKWDLYISSRYVKMSFMDTWNRAILHQFEPANPPNPPPALSLYAKYYFALRSLVEKVDFRQRYNRMVGGVASVAQSEALKIQKRTEQVKEEALLQISRSM